jgi:hypothetical protein
MHLSRSLFFPSLTLVTCTGSHTPVSLFVRRRTKEGESQQIPSRTNPSILLKIPKKVTRGGVGGGRELLSREPAEVFSFSTRPETRERFCARPKSSLLILFTGFFSEFFALNFYFFLISTF